MNNLKEQYSNESNLQKRIQIHRYGTAKEGWFDFLKKHIVLNENCRILEIGCGTGTLWKSLLDKKPSVLQIVLSDFSEGMLAKSKENLKEYSDAYDIQFLKMDATEIPYPDQSFDLVIANHVLYHVSDVEKSLSEISRSLVRDGLFFATTIGKNNMTELKTIVRTYFPETGNEAFFTGFLQNFSLENAMQKTNPFFSKCERIDYHDHLLIPTPAPLINYIESLNLPSVLNTDLQKREFEQKLLRDFDFTEGLRIRKEIGLIKCRK